MRVSFIGFICAALLGLVVAENVVLLQAALIKEKAVKQAVQTMAPLVVPAFPPVRGNGLVPPPPPF